MIKTRGTRRVVSGALLAWNPAFYFAYSSYVWANTKPEFQARALYTIANRAYFSVYYYTKCVLLKAHCATLKMKMCNINFMLGIKTGAAEPTEQQFTDLYWPANGCRWRFAAGSVVRPEYRRGRSAASGPLTAVRRWHATNGPAPCLRNWASTNFYFIGFLSTVLLWYYSTSIYALR